jgi:hypothetical protein
MRLLTNRYVKLLSLSPPLLPPYCWQVFNSCQPGGEACPAVGEAPKACTSSNVSSSAASLVCCCCHAACLVLLQWLQAWKVTDELLHLPGKC